MAEYIFGAGTLIAKRTDVTNTMPALLGVLQDITLDFSRKIEGLLGQYMSPVAFGGGELSIKGKAKFGRIQATQFNNLFFNSTQTASSGQEMTTGESGTVTTAAVTVANGATFVEDAGVFNAATGVQLQPVASGPATGVSYVPGAAGVGTYTFNAGDNGTAYLFYYTYTVTTENKIVLANQLMGPVTNFKLFIKQQYTVFGVNKNLFIQLNNCVSEKLALNFTNAKFVIPEMDIMAGADAANNIGIISITE
jgi:hypothetical protein